MSGIEKLKQAFGADTAYIIPLIKRNCYYCVIKFVCAEFAIHPDALFDSRSNNNVLARAFICYYLSRYIDGMTQDGISEMMNITQPRVSKAITSISDLLRSDRSMQSRHERMSTKIKYYIHQ